MAFGSDLSSEEDFLVFKVMSTKNWLGMRRVLAKNKVYIKSLLPGASVVLRKKKDVVLHILVL